MFGKRQNPKQLDPPPIATSDPNAQKVLRVWAAPGSPQQLTLRTTWEDPGAWGMMIVDIANHAANAYENEGSNRGVVLARIRELFELEWAHPTDVAKEIELG